MNTRETARPQHQSSTSAAAAAYPLTPLQAGLLAHHLWEPGSGVDIVQIVCTLPETPDVAALRQAWADVTTHHEVLRTGFRWEGIPEPFQEIHPHTVIPFRELDWGGHSAEHQQSLLEGFLTEDRRIGFDLATPPLLRLALIRTGAAASTLIWTYHHILFDGRALPPIFREVFARYEALRRGERPDFPTPAPFRNYVEWVSAQDWTRSEPFWRSTLAGFTAATPLPVPFPPDPAAADPGAAGECVLTIDPETTDQLRRFAKQHGLSLGILVQGAWALLLARYSRESDVVFGVTRTSRRTSVAGAEDMIGLLINTVPLRIRAEGDEPLMTWLEGVRDRWRELRDHEHTPLRLIQAWNEAPPGTSLFDTLVVYEEFLLDQVLRDTGPEWRDRSFRIHEKTNYALTLAAYGSAVLTLKLRFDPRKATGTQASRLLDHLQVMLSGMPAHGDRPIGDLAMLLPEERWAELDGWNATSSPPGKPATVAELICRAATHAPEQPAVVSGALTLSWSELMARASRLARALQAQGVGPEVPVGLCLERSPDLITGMVGIILSGGAFVPLLPGDPAARLTQQIEESDLRFAVSDQAHRKLLPADLMVTCTDDPVLEALPGTPPLSAATSDSLAYVLFTSGSTGTPKGVAVTHANLLHYIQATADQLGLQLSGMPEPWHCATVSTLAVDLGHTSVFLALCSGGVLHLVPDELLLDAAGYKEWMARQSIDLLKITPGHFQALTGPEFAPEHLPRRWLVLGGEALTWSLVDPVLAACRCRVINEYGPTETTVGVCDFEPGSRDISGWASATVPIGLPLPNTTAHVLDARQQPVPPGVPGELWIGGLGVARGYLGRAELTRERFVTRDGERRYRTGDQVRRLPTGDLEYLGRLDTQVKIRGHRVELGEIEALIAGHPDVAACVVTAPVDAFGSRQVLAFVVPRADSPGLAEKLRTHLKERVPSHMLPSRIVPLASFPLLPSGKVDRRALQAPADLPKSEEAVPESPESTLEAVLIRIWEDLLPGRAIGPTDDFFALGGHSLLAARMVDEIAKVIGFKLPLAVLFRGATVRDIARYSVGGVQAEVRPEVIEVQAGRPGVTPFFMVHGDFTGGGFYCRWLAEAAGPDQPFYAVPPYVPQGPNPALTIQEMAARHAESVRKVQPRGPYRLGGYCMGGFTAYELARRLRAEGEEVDLLLLVDSSPTSARFRLVHRLLTAFCHLTVRDPEQRADRFAYLMGRILDVRQLPLMQRFSHYLGMPGRWIARKLRRSLTHSRPLPEQLPEPVDASPQPVSSVASHHTRASLTYFPGHYDGRVDVLWTTDAQQQPTAQDLGWDRVAREVALITTPDNHITVVTKSLPGVFAAALARLKSGVSG